MVVTLRTVTDNASKTCIKLHHPCIHSKIPCASMAHNGGMPAGGVQGNPEWWTECGGEILPGGGRFFPSTFSAGGQIPFMGTTERAAGNIATCTRKNHVFRHEHGARKCANSPSSFLDVFPFSYCTSRLIVTCCVIDTNRCT